MSILGFIVNRAAKLPKVTDFENYLFVGPHPDDIEIGAGALVSKLVGMGKKVSFVICTDGRYGNENCPELTERELIEIRKQEAIDSAAALGVNDVLFLNLSDGGMYEIKDLETALAKVFGESGAEVVFAPDPDVRNECHKDHLNVGTAVKQISYFSRFENIMAKYDAKAGMIKALGFYMTDRPNRFVKVSKADFEKQIKAVFDCHLSQYPKDTQASKSVRLYLGVRSVCFGLKRFHCHGEGVRMLDIMRMHCLPEGR